MTKSLKNIDTFTPHYKQAGFYEYAWMRMNMQIMTYIIILLSC